MNNNTNTKGLIYPNPCPHCGKENTKKACYEFIGEQNGRRYQVCMRGANPAIGWEQALTRNKTPRTDKAGYPVYQEIIPYNGNGSPKKNFTGYTQYHKPEAEYFYHDKQGKPLVKIEKRRNDKGEKYYPQYHYTSDGKWAKGVKDYIKREDIPIYRYKDIRCAIESGDAVWIVEGEKCADELSRIGLFTATCNIGGAGKTGSKWKLSDTACLNGAKEIILCPDQDKIGIQHMEAIYKQLLDYGFAESSIKWLYCYPHSEKWENIPEAHGLDVYDWINDGATYQELLGSVREEKRAIALPNPKNESSNSNQDVAILSSSVEKNKWEEIKNKLYPLFWTEGYEKNPPKRKKPDNGDYLKAIHIIYGDRLRYNLQTLEPWLDDKPFKEVEGELEQLYIRLSYLYGVEMPKEKVVDSILLLAKEKRFHPVEDYLRRITKEVEPIDINNLAARYFGLTDELSNTYLKHWLLSATARPIYPGCYTRNVLILQGKQDIGKSTFFRLLGGEHFCDSLGDCKDKDQKMIAHRKHIHEWAEFEKLWRKSMRSEVKAFIAATEDTFRVPYGRTTDTFPRRFILCGTSNEEQFLKDPTGNDRFWIISVKQKIALEQLTKDRDAIWSAAMRIVLNANPHEVTTGKLWKLPEHLLKANKENTAKHEEVHEWEHQLQDVIDSWGNAGWIRADKLWEALDIEIKEQGKHSNTFSDIMRKLGWKRGGVKRIKSEGQWKTYRIWIPIDSD